MIRHHLLRMLLHARGDGEPSDAKKRIGSWMLRNVPGMLTCEELESFIHDYHAGALEKKQRSRFEMHLALCPMCQVHFDAYVRTVELGQRVCEEDELPENMPEELAGAIRLALEAQRDRDA